MSVNKLLERQIKKYLPDGYQHQEDLQRFIQAVGESYEEYERDRKLFDHAVNLIEKDYSDINNKLKEEVQSKHDSIQHLKQTINQFKGMDSLVYNDTDDLQDVINYLENELNEKKKADELLELSEKRLRLALQTIDDNVWEYHFPSRTMTFELSGKSVQNQQKTDYPNIENEEWWQSIYEEDRPIAVNTFRQYMSGEITRHCVEYRVKTKSGNIKWLLNRGGIISSDENGKPVTIIGALTDITERKISENKLQEQEEKYRSIIANMNLGLIEVDLTENIRYVNQCFCDMSGFTEEELIGQNASQLFVNPEHKQFLQEKQKLREQGESDAYEIHATTKNGTNNWWLVCGAPLYNDKHELTGSIGVHLDITEQKMLSQQLIEAKIVAERSVQAKDLFLANMSHEIRTPMNAILGMSKQLQKTPLNQQQQSFLDIIGTAAEHLLVIINDILDFSKLDAGKVTLEEIAFNMNDLAYNTSRVLRLKAEEKGLVFNVSVSDDVATVLKGDPYRINQVLMNLLSNSIKFTQKGVVKLQCRVTDNSLNRQQLEIIVSDTGKGIDEAYLKNLFNKFSQEDDSIARSYGGTGLGMSIVKQLVELMNGAITVNSKKGEGTQVIINLSLPKGQDNELLEKDSHSIEAHSLAGKKILLVEDNEMNRVVARTILQQYGAAVTDAVNGAEAIQAMQNDLFDIVLMDIQMPVMDGMEATSTIRRELCSAIPIIALTANAVKGEMDKCLQAGMNDYLSKPFEEEDLIRLIAKWLGREIHFEPHKETATSNSQLYDLEPLREITRGEEEVMIKMLQVFISDTNKSLTELVAAFGESDIQKVRFVAHRIKSSLGNLSINSAAKLAQQIELTECTDNDHAALAPLINELKDIVEKVMIQLQQECQPITS